MIERPNEYAELALDQRTVILKIHGAVDRLDSEWGDSYVITEDHYIDYLTRTDISGLLPVTLSAKLRRSHFLFLGYAMRDWNLRVILHRIWGQQKLNYKSWAIQLEPEPVEREFWQKRGVDILDVELERYVTGLGGRAQAATWCRDRYVSGAVSSGRTRLGGAQTDARTTAAAERPGDLTSPYKGLTPYTEGDAAFFFGRETEREIIVANLMAARLTVLYGPSGVGKSSVLRAGVLRDLHRMTRRNKVERGVPEFAPVVFSDWRRAGSRSGPARGCRPCGVRAGRGGTAVASGQVRSVSGWPPSRKPWAVRCS